MCTISMEVRALRIYALGNIDLGTACGKFFRVGCLSITDSGDADLGSVYA